MTGFLLYMVKGTLYLSVFYTFFMLVMRKTTFLRLNRIAFLVGTFICMVLPFIKISMPENVAMEMPITIIGNVIAPAVVTSDIVSATGKSTGPAMAISLILLVGMLFSMCITARSYFRMNRMLRTVPVTMIDGTTVRITDAEIPPFSWGKHIVISRADYEHNPAILTHERMHVKCRHSIDLMTYTIVTVMHWFNPLVWIARTELKMLHEYEADELTINTGIDATQYQLLLVRKAVGAKRFQLANGFNHSKLKNRITMMHKTKTNRWMRLAYILCIPALIGTMCLCSNPEQVAKKIDNITVTVVSTGTILDGFTLEQLDSAILNSGVDPIELAVQIAPQTGYSIEDLNTVKERLRELDVLMVSYADTNETPVSATSLDVKPTFNGEEVYQFSRWVNLNIEYPQEAKDKNIQGRVAVSFTVNSKGKVCDVEVVKGVDPLLDKEAVRVVEMSPEWTPGMVDGKAVPVRYTFPIIFMLSDTEQSE